MLILLQSHDLWSSFFLNVSLCFLVIEITKPFEANSNLRKCILCSILRHESLSTFHIIKEDAYFMWLVGNWRAVLGQNKLQTFGC